LPERPGGCCAQRCLTPFRIGSEESIVLRCLSCHEPLREEPERIGARCPHCRQPLFEDPRQAAPAAPAAGASVCATRPQNAAVGTCQRCGNFLCAVCRTRWRNQAVCIACVERALEAKEARASSNRCI